MYDRVPRYHILDFCNGQLMVLESFETSTEVDMYLVRHCLEDPLIIYGYNLTGYFKKGA